MKNKCLRNWALLALLAVGLVITLPVLATHAGSRSEHTGVDSGEVHRQYQVVILLQELNSLLAWRNYDSIVAGGPHSKELLKLLLRGIEDPIENRDDMEQYRWERPACF